MFKIPAKPLLKGFVSKYCFASKSFTNFNELQTYLKTEKPVLACMYFRANWNPMCEQADEDFEKLSNNYPGVDFIKVDNDKDRLFKSYFGVKVEPEFIVTCLGSEMIRHTGLNLALLKEKITRVNEHFQETEFVGRTGKYEEFQGTFKEDYEEVWKKEDYWET